MKQGLIAIVFAAACLSASAASNWKPAGDMIKTRWASKVNPTAPLPEYPRPQIVRADWQNLNGLWSYAITAADAKNFKSEGQILVPFAVESSLSGVQRYVGKEKALWYERSFIVPKQWKNKNVLLHFGAVDWQSDLWVNGQKVGQHKGGYTPFSYDITKYLNKSGKQTVRLRVWDASDNSFQPRGKQVVKSSGIWYTPVTGIWQTVWMEPVEKTHINNYYVVSDVDNSKMNVSVDLADAQASDQVKVEILDGGIGYDPEKPSAKVIANAVAQNGSAEITVPNAQLWSPESPYLYGLRLTVTRNGKVVDQINGYTQMRKVSKKKDDTPNHYNRMALNNNIRFEFGPLDQGWWPDGLYTAPTDEALKYDIQETKDWGFNMIRKHIKVEPARWYFYCDQIGITVWQDMPSIGDHSKSVLANRDPEIANIQKNKWSSDSFLGGTDCPIPQEWKDNYYKEWKEIIAALKNFQCIVVWVPFNEAWGQFDTPEVVKFTREQDGTRLINESSGGNYSLSGDILDAHHYPCPAMNVFEGKMINVLGEYGGIGFPVKGHLWQQDRNWGYGKVKENGKEVLDQYSEFAEMLKTFIKTGCSAAVYTQTTDVEIEVNGIMTYDRAVTKMDATKLKEINQSVINSLK